VPRCTARVIPILHPVLRRLARRRLAVTPESNRFTSVGAAAVSRTPAHDIVGSPFARQTSRFGPDRSFFDSHSSRMTRDMTELMMIISARVFLIIPLLFHVIAVMSVISALMTVIIALMSLIIRVMPVMTARMTDMTKVMSILIRMMWFIIRMTCLMKKVMSDIIGKLTARIAASTARRCRPADRSRALPWVRDAAARHGDLTAF
jgi:hypothetical protein